MAGETVKRTICITIGEAPITKKNHQQILRNRKTGAPFVAPSRQYKEYEARCGQWLMLRGGCRMQTIDYPVNVKCIFYVPTRRRVDLTNLEESIDDILVKFGILKDDSYTILAGHDGSRVRIDKESPRTEITITPMEEGEQNEID